MRLYRQVTENLTPPSFRFTIWDILFFTTLVASIFALPPEALHFVGALAATSAVMLVLLSLITFFAKKNMKGRRASSERFILHLLIRGLTYSVAILGVGLVALGMWAVK